MTPLSPSTFKRSAVRAAKTLAARLWTACGLDRSRPRGSVILTYHRVLPAELLGESANDATVSPSITVSLEGFREQLDALSDRFDIVSLDELVEDLTHGSIIPGGQADLGARRRRAVLTFDDGWLDNWRYALPELEKRGLPATVFLSTGFIGTRRRMWWDELARGLAQAAGDSGALRRRVAELVVGSADTPSADISGQTSGRFSVQPPDQAAAQASVMAEALADFPGWPLNARRRFLETAAESMKLLDGPALEARLAALAEAVGLDREADEPVMLDWDQAADMAKRGMTLGSHTVGHAILPRLRPEEARRELAASARAMEERGLGPVRLLCYPNGDADAQTVRLVREAGYAAAVTTSPGHILPGAPLGGDDRYLLPRINVSMAQERPRSRFLFHIARAGRASFPAGAPNARPASISPVGNRMESIR